MTNLYEVYKCGVCGNTTRVIHASGGTMVCCGQPMTLMPEKTDDAGKEKHVPVVEKSAKGIIVKVGSVPHPMEEKHYIEWIELLADGKAYRQFLNPGDAPTATFNVSGTNLSARELCNLHGVWSAKG